MLSINSFRSSTVEGISRNNFRLHEFETALFQYLSDGFGSVSYAKLFENETGYLLCRGQILLRFAPFANPINSIFVQIGLLGLILEGVKRVYPFFDVNPKPILYALRRPGQYTTDPFWFN